MKKFVNFFFFINKTKKTRKNKIFPIIESKNLIAQAFYHIHPTQRTSAYLA